MRIRAARPDDTRTLIALATEAVGTERAGPLIRSHAERHHLLVADVDAEVAGVLAYRTDWFQCTYVSLVSVREDYRRRGVARALFEVVESMSPSPRVFSSSEETNVSAIRMHVALGFAPSGHIDNLPQGYRELLFYKRVTPAPSAGERRGS